MSNFLSEKDEDLLNKLTWLVWSYGAPDDAVYMALSDLNRGFGRPPTLEEILAYIKKLGNDDVANARLHASIEFEKTHSLLENRP